MKSDLIPMSIGLMTLKVLERFIFVAGEQVLPLGGVFREETTFKRICRR